MTLSDLPVGTEIYYHGDMANRDGFGKIVKHTAGQWVSPSVTIDMEDGRHINLLPVCIFSEKYLGHGGTRFVTRAAYNRWYTERMAAYAARSH